MRHLWKATWDGPGGQEQEFIFESIENMMIAGIDFKLKVACAGITLPEKFILEEISYEGNRKPDTLTL